MTKYWADCIVFTILSIVLISVLVSLPEHEYGTKTVTTTIDYINGTDFKTQEITPLKVHDDVTLMTTITGLAILFAFFAIVLLFKTIDELGKNRDY